MNKKTILLVWIFLLLGFSAYAQGDITGTVTDDSGNPLPGATVTVAGTSTGAVTDIDGNYTISVEGIESPVLNFSYVGYLTDEVAVGDQTVINVSLVSDMLMVDELVVIGYGTVRKSLVTGAISKVGAEEFENTTVTRVEQAIQGKAAGVYVAQNSGEPGGGLSIKIRGVSSDGTNEPIYLVDGVRTGGLEYLNPADIESVEILKDAASAAIYGAEGGNGVVLITTKKGEKGKGRVEYRYSYGVQQAVNLPNVMNAEQYKEYFLEATEIEGRGSEPFENLDVTNGTNWLDEVFVKAPMSDHQLSFSGGGEKTTYYLSLGALDQDGIVGGPKNNLTRYSFRANVENEVKEWLSVGVNASYSHYKKKPLDATDQYGGIVTTALRYDPTTPIIWATDDEIPEFYMSELNYKALVKDENERPYAISDLTSGEMWNPVAKIAYTEREDVQDKVLADFHADLKPTKWIKLTSRFFVDYSYQTTNRFNGRTMFGVSDKVTHDTLTNAEQRWNKWFKYGIENFITFDKTFGDHYIQVMAGMSYEDYHYTWLQAKGYDIPYGDVFYGYPNLGRDNERNEISGSAGDEWQEIDLRASYFGRAMYNYKERYIAQGSYRIDGLSKFGPDEKWGYFPSFSLGWNLHREDFFSSTNLANLMSNAKLRYSWGKNGSAQNLSSFPYVTTLSSVDYVDGTIDGNLLPGLVPGTPGNSALLWETNVQSNIGADFGFMRNALTFSVDYFKRVTTDQLADKSDQPFANGMTGTAKVNDGEIQNKGWEFIVTYKGNVGDLKYSVSANASYIKNEVTQFGVEEGKEGGGIGQLGNVSKYEVGQPVWYFYGFQADGIFQNADEVAAHVDSAGNRIQRRARPGDVRYIDINENGRIDPEDRTYLGKPLPDWYYGFNIGLEYKGIDIQAFFQGVAGNQIFWASYRNDNLRTNRTSVWYEERWTGEGTSTTYPRATLDDVNNNYRISSLNVHDGDYLRLKNLSIGYTLPNSLTSKVGVERFKIFYTGTNLLTFTKYPGTDPEVGNSKASWEWNQAQFLGVDNGMYPATKIHTVGLQLSF